MKTDAGVPGLSRYTPGLSVRRAHPGILGRCRVNRNFRVDVDANDLGNGGADGTLQAGHRLVRRFQAGCRGKHLRDGHDPAVIGRQDIPDDELAIGGALAQGRLDAHPASILPHRRSRPVIPGFQVNV